jgi:hypothetical protein
MSSPNALSFHALSRSALVLAGMLFLAVGIGNVISGQSKITQYEEVLHSATPPSPPADPAALFPAASEGEERHELALAKLAFYHLLVTAGRVLSALGAFLLCVGVLRVWASAPPAQARSARAN